MTRMEVGWEGRWCVDDSQTYRPRELSVETSYNRDLGPFLWDSGNVESRETGERDFVDTSGFYNPLDISTGPCD